MMRNPWPAALAASAVALAAVGPALAAPGVDCLLEPWQVVEVRSPVDGLIASISVQRGDAIRRGQVLVQLQSEAERTTVDLAAARAKAEGAIAAARNRIDYATKKLARLTDLMKDNFSTQQALDEAAAEKKLAEAELQSATESRDLAQVDLRRSRELLAMRTMTAPFNGVVVDRMLNPGDLAESGSGRKPALRVAQTDPIRADVALPAALFGQVRPGTRANVTPVIGGGPFAATVRHVDRVIDAASGTFIARLEVPNPQGLVPAGARCSASIDGVVVPARAAAVRGALP